MKKIVTIFIAMIMIVSLAKTDVLAEEETFEKDGLTYTVIGENNISVTAADLTQSEYHIPETVTFHNVQYTVVSLGQQLFYKSEGAALTKITLPNTLKRIESAAFKTCKNLTSIEIPDGIQAIEMSTFENCTKLKSIKLPNQLKSIKGDAFRNCGLEAIHIPDSVYDIANNAFISCSSLVSVVIPKNVKYLGGSAFWYCDKLEDITLPNVVDTIHENIFKYSSRLSRIMIMTETKDEAINNQILTAIANINHSLQVYRGVTQIKAKQTQMTTYPYRIINLDSYFITSFDVYDENDQPSNVMKIPQNYQKTEYKFIGAHSEQTYIEENQLIVSSNETNQLQIEARLNNHTKTLIVNVIALDVEGIEIVKMPDRTTYVEGEIFDPTGLKIKVHYSDGSYEIIAYDLDTKDNFYFDMLSPLKISNQKVLMKFANHSTEFNITVQSKPIINDNPNQPNDSQKDYNQNQSQTPVTGDTTTFIVLSVLLILSASIICVSIKRRKENI